MKPFLLENKMSNALALITGEINAVREEFVSLLADKSISFEREAGFALQILGANDYAMKVAVANRLSLVAAVKNLAAIGISLNPARKQAYLVPRSMGRDKPAAICLDISYMGLMDLAIATGSVKWAKAEVVREHDEFRLRGLDKPPDHAFQPFAKDRGVIVGVYVVVKTADGDYLTHTMNADEVFAIRDRSEAWKAYREKKIKSCPWVTDEAEMVKKTCVKQGSKYWPKTERLMDAIHHLNTDGGEGLVDISERPAGIDVAPLIAAALATHTDADALKFWKENNAQLVKQPADHKRLKEAIAGHRAKMVADDAARTVDMPADDPLQDAPVEDAQMTDEELDAQRGAGRQP